MQKPAFYPTLILLSAIIFFPAACRNQQKDGPARNITRGFYFWKSGENPTAHEEAVFRSCSARLLYQRFFDVVWDAENNRAVPVAQKKPGPFFTTSGAQQLVPVVFITNETLAHTDSAGIVPLANKIYDLLQALGKDEPRLSKELQIDCDWTALTRDRYFSLLTQIKNRHRTAYPREAIVSATIRLYQLKYAMRTGVPPADKGLLMCYNMGNLKDYRTRNSIIETGELEKYISALSGYPLACDIALPLFDWYVWFRGTQYRGLMYPHQLPALPLKENLYTFNTDTVIGGQTFYKGDLLRYENSGIHEIRLAAAAVGKQLKNKQPALLLYHLDSVTLNKYTVHELEEIFSALH
jgi:hypothetical protein